MGYGLLVLMLTSQRRFKMKKYCLTNTLYENQLEARIEGYKAHIKALESEMDNICKMWDEDRRKLREIKK